MVANKIPGDYFSRCALRFIFLFPSLFPSFFFSTQTFFSCPHSSPFFGVFMFLFGYGSVLRCFPVFFGRSAVSVWFFPPGLVPARIVIVLTATPGWHLRWKVLAGKLLEATDSMRSWPFVNRKVGSLAIMFSPPPGPFLSFITS